MAIREILVQGESALEKKCHLVTSFDQRLGDLLDDLKETLLKANGLGLAAPQIGILRRAVVIDHEGELLELVNPEILEMSGEESALEGCLSVPGYWGYVNRPTMVKIKAQNRAGEVFELEGNDLLARCICHELDHLDGQLYAMKCEKLYTAEELDEQLGKEK